MKYFLFLIALCIFSIQGKSQQGNIWYFGEGHGLNFNSSSPEILSGGQIIGYPQNENENLYSEGSSAISDNSGELLFYSNGEKVWDKNHDLMPNGGDLMGMYSSTHSSLIVPLPESDSIFYVFTTDGIERDLENGMRYSVVDMCLNDGLGDVIEEEKNISMIDLASEKIAAIQHSNGIDYWIVGHEYNSADFYVFPLTSSGIGTPSITTIGSIHQGNGFFASIGQMKASPDGTKIGLVFSNVNPSVIELFDFDASTGDISNQISLDQNNNEYGLEFSPDNSKLYITNLSGVWQFDLAAGGGEEEAINASKTNISTVGCIPSGMQLGPDNKIYISRCSNSIDVINLPNETGNSCDLEEQAITFGSLAVSSLPSFIAGYSYNNETVNCRTVEISELENSTVSIYPNPAVSSINVKIEGRINVDPVLSIYDLSGKLILPKQRMFSSNTTIDLTEIDPGIYFAHITFGSQNVKSKIIVN